MDSGLLARLTKRYTDSVDAYQAYLNGRYNWSKPTQEGLWKAIDFFQRAIAADGNYALAYVGLADAYAALDWYGMLSTRESNPHVLAAAEKALAIDGDLAEAHAALAVARQNRWDWAGAERMFRRALELNPNFAYGHKLYAESLSYVGRFEEAIAEAQLARRLDPLSVVTNSLVGLVLYRARQYDDALEALEQAIELDPNHPMPYLPQGLALSMLGRHDEAIAALEKGVAASGRSSEMLAQLALAHGRAGRTSRARALLSELRARSRMQHVSPFAFALVHTGLGERGTAIEALEEAYRHREWLLCVLKTEPIFDPLRGDPRFDDLLRRIDLPS